MELRGKRHTKCSSKYSKPLNGTNDASLTATPNLDSSGSGMKENTRLLATGLAGPLKPLNEMLADDVRKSR